MWFGEMMTEVKKNYTSVIPMTSDGKILLQRKTQDYPFWPNCFATFGGGIKNGESPLESITREFRKETGIDLENPMDFCEQIFLDESKLGERKTRNGIIYWFASELNGNISNIKITEGAGYEIFSESELKRLSEKNLIVPYQYETIRKFFEGLRGK